MVDFRRSYTLAVTAGHVERPRVSNKGVPKRHFSQSPSSSPHARRSSVQWTELASFPMTQLLDSFKLVTTLAAASAPTPPSVQLGSSRASSTSGLISSSSSDKARYSASAQVDRI